MSHKLPSWHIFKKALSLVWEKSGFALQVGWPVIVMSAGLGLAIDAGYEVLPSAMGASGTASGPGATGPGLTGQILFISAVQSFLLAVVAVYWHRNILLQERQAPALPLRFDAVVWRYIGYAILLFLVTIAILLGAGAMFTLVAGLSGTLTQAGDVTSGAGGLLVGLLLIGFVLGLLVVIFRCSLVLPAAAIGHHGFSLGVSWRTTRGNGWQILALHVLTLLFAVGTGFAIGVGKAAAVTLIGSTPQWMVLAGTAAINLVYVLLGISLLSLSYAYLTYQMPQEDAAMEA